MTHLRYPGSGLVLGMLVLGIVGCTAPDRAGTAPERRKPETYAVDHTHSAALFEVKHFGISLVAGRFTDIDGTIVADRNDPSKSSVEVIIKTASVNTDNKARDKHLRNADFLDVEKFPVMSFKSEHVKKLKGNAYEVTGSFTLHGVTRTITVPVAFLGETDVPWGQHRAGFQTSFVIKRTDYGMGELVGPAGDEVRITLLVEAMRTDPPPKKKARK